jgi:hypothetical protein
MQDVVGWVKGAFRWNVDRFVSALDLSAADRTGSARNATVLSFHKDRIHHESFGRIGSALEATQIPRVV